MCVWYVCMCVCVCVCVYVCVCVCMRVCVSQDILSACIEENVQCFMQLPYFEGDFIPNLGEDVVKDYNRDENERLAASTADSSQTNSKVCTAKPARCRRHTRAA